MAEAFGFAFPFHADQPPARFFALLYVLRIKRAFERLTNAFESCHGSSFNAVVVRLFVTQCGDEIHARSSTRGNAIRRNMLVHTEGRITERYLSELRQAGESAEGLNIGESLIPDINYLRVSLQRLIALEVMLLFRVISHIEKTRLDAAAGSVSEKLEFCVKHRMWEAAHLISDAFGDTQCMREIQLNIKVNGWLARKFIDGIDNVRGEVTSWDVSGLNEKYSIIKDLLLDQLTPEELADVVASGIFTNFEVSTHPLFEKFRKESENISNEDSVEGQPSADKGADH